MRRFIQNTLIQYFHNFKVIRTFLTFFLLQTVSCDSQKSTLLTYTQGTFFIHKQFRGCYRPNLCKLFFKKSFSISNWPIFEYSLSVSIRVSVSSCTFSNTWEERDKNSCFHLLIIVACTSNRTDNSASVSRSFKASIAT